MLRRLLYLAISLFATATHAADEANLQSAHETATAQPVLPDSVQMEKELQGLDWKQFRTVIESVPRMRADVDAYGPLGWQYVKGNYTTYSWHKSIDRLDPAQRQQLVALIQAAKTAR